MGYISQVGFSTWLPGWTVNQQVLGSCLSGSTRFFVAVSRARNSALSPFPKKMFSKSFIVTVIPETESTIVTISQTQDCLVKGNPFPCIVGFAASVNQDQTE